MKSYVKSILKKNKAFMKVYKAIMRETRPWGFINGYIVFPIQRFIRLHVYCPQKYKKIEILRDCHKGERCFIIATGPSLTISDVSLLKDEYTIGMNEIFKMSDQLNWKPTYYSMTDPVLFNKLYNNGLTDVGSCSERYSFVNALNEKLVKNDDKVIFIHNCWLDHVYHRGTSNQFRFDKQPVGGVYDYYSSTHECIYYAIFMGFKEIYLIGADNDYVGNKQHYTDIKGVDKIKFEEALDIQTSNDRAYSYLASVAKKEGVSIFNATRGGRVEVFPRVNLEDVIGKSNKN